MIHLSKVSTAFSTVMDRGVTQAETQANYIPERDRIDQPESYYTSAVKEEQTTLISKKSLLEKDDDLKRDSMIHKAIDYNLRNKRALEEKRSTNKSTMESNGENKEGDLHAEITKLQAQIRKTTIAVDQLYEPFTNYKDNHIHNANNDGSKQLSAVERKMSTKNALYTTWNEKTGNNCCGSAEVMNLRSKLSLERSVRNQMIRILAREKLRNERKTKALQAILRYYHPDKEVLRQLSLPMRLKKVIIAERIKMLPIGKQVELARRLKRLFTKTKLIYNANDFV